MRMNLLETIAASFLAGAIGVITLHQGALLVLSALRIIPIAPYSFRPTEPFGVPQLASIMFWGGVWGVTLALLLRSHPALDRLATWVVLGAVFPSAVAALVVTPLKGGDIHDWMDPRRIAIALSVNGLWGLGTYVAYTFLRRRRATAA
jgi:hypothetical protein